MIRRHPLLFTWCLKTRNACRRAFATPGRVLGTLTAAIAVGGLFWWGVAAVPHDCVRQVSALLRQYAIALAVMAAIHSLLLVTRTRERATDAHRASWLAAAPLHPRTMGLAILVRTVGIAGLHLALIALPLAGIAILADDLHLNAQSVALVATGFATGGLAGWFLPPRKMQMREASRYAPKLRQAASQRCTDRALAHWPVAQALAWHRPENSRVVVLVALLAVQGGTSIAGGLAVVGAWLLAIHLATLLQAVIHTGPAAARWLRSTPIRFAAFAWALSRRVLLHQSIGTAVAVAMGIVLGAPPLLAIYLGGCWLVLVAMVSAIVLADAYRSRRSGLKLVMSMVAFAAIELREQGWAVPLALVLGLWHVFMAVRSPRAAV